MGRLLQLYISSTLHAAVSSTTATVSTDVILVSNKTSGAINGWDYSDPPYASAVIMFLASQLFLFLFLLVFEAVTAYNDEQEVNTSDAPPPP